MGVSPDSICTFPQKKRMDKPRDGLSWLAIGIHEFVLPFRLEGFVASFNAVAKTVLKSAFLAISWGKIFPLNGDASPSSLNYFDIYFRVF